MTPALAQAIEAAITLRPSEPPAQSFERRVDGHLVALFAPGVEPLDLVALHPDSGTVSIRAVPADSGDGSVSVYALTPTTVMLAALRCVQPRRVGVHQRCFM